MKNMDQMLKQLEICETKTDNLFGAKKVFPVMIECKELYLATLKGEITEEYETLKKDTYIKIEKLFKLTEDEAQKAIKMGFKLFCNKHLK